MVEIFVVWAAAFAAFAAFVVRSVVVVVDADDDDDDDDDDRVDEEALLVRVVLVVVEEDVDEEEDRREEAARREDEMEAADCSCKMLSAERTSGVDGGVGGTKLSTSNDASSFESIFIWSKNQDLFFIFYWIN